MADGGVYRELLSALKPDSENPRIHSNRQVRQIAKSIEAFGFNVPLLVDAKGKVIAGHGRLRAAGQVGMREVPTITLEHLSEAQAKAFMIADNRLSEIATWDEKLLAEELKQLSEVELDFDLEVTGFHTAEIDLRIEALSAGSDGSGRKAVVPDMKVIEPPAPILSAEYLAAKSAPRKRVSIALLSAAVSGFSLGSKETTPAVMKT